MAAECEKLAEECGKLAPEFRRLAGEYGKLAPEFGKLAAVFGILAGVSGIPPPVFRIPSGVCGILADTLAAAREGCRVERGGFAEAVVFKADGEVCLRFEQRDGGAGPASPTVTKVVGA